MITEIRFLSLAAMARLRRSRDTVVVSILDRSEAARRPVLRGFRSVLVLDFEDVYEEVVGAEAGDWTDEPTDEEHARHCVGVGERLPALSDARRIVDFVLSHHRSDERLKLVVHCFGGVSRSAAVAEWSSARLGLPIASDCSQARPNLRLLRLLAKADVAQRERL